ncbi:MAG: low-complexity protein, partial [Cyanobacteria bacterium P01_C01_bin.147]
MASRLWKFLTTDIRELASLDTVDSSKDAAEAVLGLAEILQTEGPNVQQLAPLVTQLDSLLDVLNSPLGNIVGASLPFVSIATGLLKFYLEQTKQEPTLAQSVALISQAAYLESFKDFVQQQPRVQKWLAASDKQAQAQALTPEVKALGDFELTDREARLALLHFHQSALATVFNRALIARLVHLGAKPEAAKKIAEMVAQNTNRYMREAIADAKEPVQRIAEWYRIGGDADFEKYLSIDTYLAEVIAPRPHEPVFAEPFTFKDIYVPLKAQLLTTAGEPDESQEPVVLEQWARQTLNDDAAKDRVLFVQGDPGRGKSVFCRMFADWVRRHEHPRWTPILIRLRDVAVLSRDFEETLAKAVDRDFAKTDLGWLTDRNVNFLFILDGFDELLMEGRTSGGLDNFLDQVGRFQEQCARNSEKNHRVLITGRTLALQAIE